MEIQGTIKVISDTKQITDTFKKRELVLTTEEQYPQHLLIEFTQDKGDLLNNFQEGQQVKVAINLRGREWTSPQGEVKYFNAIHGWRIESLQAETSNTSDVPPVPPIDAFEPAEDSKDDDYDDLPF